MRTILFMFFMLLVYLGLGTTIGLKWTVLLMALVFFIMATLFVVKKEYYYKYVALINPKYNEICDEKGEEFKNKNRRTNIICWYLMSILFLFQVAITRENRVLFEGMAGKDLILFLGIIMLFSILIFLISMYILKKSKSNGEFVGYSVILGIAAAIILMAVMSIFIFSRILH